MVRTPFALVGTIVMAVIVVALATLAPPCAAQTGWNLRQFIKRARTTPKPMTFQITNAKSWGTGYSQTFKPYTSICEEYRVQLTVGTKFISLTVTNPNVCDWHSCSAPTYANPGCKWSDSAVVATFAVEWIDKSTTATFTLPTRQNTPENIAMEVTTLTIPEALDRTLVTNLMDVVITILPIETTTLAGVEDSMHGSVPDDLYDTKIDFVDFARSNAERSVGIKYRYHIREWGSTMYGYTFHRRKGPTPPFMFKHRFGDGCTWTPGPTEACQGPGGGYYDRIKTFDDPVSDWNYYRMDCATSHCDYHYIHADDGDSWSYYDFYEDFRLHKVSATVDWADVKAATALPANDYGMNLQAIDANNETTLTIRLVWRNLTEYRTSATTDAEEAAEAQKTVGLYVIPPGYPIQDIWVTVHTDAGKRVFHDMERRVPYRNPASNIGHIGWMWALNERFDAATEYTIVARFNRQAKSGTTEEERLANLVRGFTEDNNGDVSNITAPIPKTILSQDGIMGGVAARDIASGDAVGRISYQTCLTNNITKNFFNRHLAKKLNTTSTWWAAWDTTTTPWYQEHLMMTLMLVTDAVSEDDYSTAFWSVYDSYYPAKPTMLMHFWDPIQVSRLLGFSELPAITATQLASWANEHAMIAEAWPWFAVEVTVAKWHYTRAHVLRSTYAQDDELFLPSFIHLLRHSPTAPNVALRAEWHTEQIYMTALADIAFQEEIFVDFNAPAFSKHEYFLRYGEVPATATDATTVPGWHGYLDLSRPSRDVLVEEWKALYGETNKQALARVISVLGVKQASMPVNVDGLGSTPEQVNMATALLTSEKTTLAWQLADANAELAAMP